MKIVRHTQRVVISAMLAVCARTVAAQSTFDLVIAHGRVIDPESKLDAVRSVGITNGRIAAISTSSLKGKRTIDAKGLVVAPGFVDLHVHGQNDENYRLYAMDGVTTALEMEVGTDDVPGFYAQREGKALINYGVSAGHIKARMSVMKDAGTFLPLDAGGRDAATDAQVADIAAHIETGLKQGALGVGMGLQYTPAASRYEVIEAFRIAAKYKRPVFVHTRAYGVTEPGSSVESYLEVIGAAAITGAPLHIVHLNSTSLSSTPKTLAMVRDARARGLDVTAEAYPYSAGMTEISSPLLDQYVNAPDSMFSHFMLAATGERLTRATFLANRKPGGMIILFLNTPEMEAMAMTSPLTSIASDGRIENGKGHPRTAGTSARTLGYYVRESKQMSLMEAIRKLALMPAQRLESVAPQFKRKGRITVGADADVSVFDPNTVIDKSTYLLPATPAIGFKYVLVNGVPIVDDGVLKDAVHPGRALRAPR
ncbi:MAG: dihydroorotase [Gemmatimonadetes bacterium]|nr:dihydroorotase [Gemmatimonadota bacterium]